MFKKLPSLSIFLVLCLALTSPSRATSKRSEKVIGMIKNGVETLKIIRNKIVGNNDSKQSTSSILSTDHSEGVELSTGAEIINSKKTISTDVPKTNNATKMIRGGLLGLVNQNGISNKKKKKPGIIDSTAELFSTLNGLGDMFKEMVISGLQLEMIDNSTSEKDIPGIRARNGKKIDDFIDKFDIPKAIEEFKKEIKKQLPVKEIQDKVVKTFERIEEGVNTVERTLNSLEKTSDHTKDLVIMGKVALGLVIFFVVFEIVYRVCTLKYRIAKDQKAAIQKKNNEEEILVDDRHYF